MLEKSAGNSPPQSRVAILLCTCQGEPYLAEQLNSFERQSHADWSVHASDDGSRDGTLSILRNYQRKWGQGRLSVYSGPKSGFSVNFMSLIGNTGIDADYFAFSDQDDLWEHDKLERALQKLEQVPPDIPALYCSRVKLVDRHNREIKLSTRYLRKPAFANALVQNIAMGNTTILNAAARRLLQETCAYLPDIPHDWWTYMVISGCGGRVFYDSIPTVRYRQHGQNLFGMNASWPARFGRIRMLWQGCFRHWNDGSITALQMMGNKLTPDSRDTLEMFAKARQKRLVPRLIGLKRSRIHRQTLLGNVGLVVASVFGKI